MLHFQENKFFLVVLGLKRRASHLLSRHSTPAQEYTLKKKPQVSQKIHMAEIFMVELHSNN
jgi:hypothetical protein